MAEIILALFMWLFAPIPWVVSALHVFVTYRRWRFINPALIIFTFILGISWISWGIWLTEHYQELFQQAPITVWHQIVGVVVLATALTIEIMTTKALTLRRVLLSSELQQNADKLITTGIYRYARHPRYIEHPFWFLGLGLLLGHTSLLLFSLYLFVSFFFTAALEERELAKRYGKQYQDYRKKVPAFFFRVC